MNALRIVVVEDDANISALFEQLLALLGHQVCANVASVGAAIDAARAWSPDLMIVDEQLGRGSGAGAMRVILQRGHVPHVYVTTYFSRVLARDPSAIIVPKPFREAELVAGMARAMATRTII